jgi:high-affinity nickel permease
MHMGVDPHGLTYFLDIVLVVSAVLALYFRPSIGGQLAVGLRLIMVGVFILGLTHLTDTLLKDFVTSIDATTRPLLHRGLNVVGFLIIFVGFFQMRKAIES